EGIGNLFTAVNLDIRASHKTDGLLDHFGVAYNDGTAAVVKIPMGQCVNCDLRAVSCRVAHGDAYNGFCTHDVVASLISACPRRRSRPQPSSESRCLPPEPD